MFALFDRKERGLVGLNEIKAVFNQYLDINISDNDILEFIEEADLDKDGFLNQQEFFAKLGYQWSQKSYLSICFNIKNSKKSTDYEE